MFDLTPYAWFASINANVNFNLPPELGGTVSASPSIGFGDLLSHVNIGFMGAVDVAQSCALLAGWHPVRSTPDDESFRRVVNG